MTVLLRFAARSDVGLLRTGNEDAAYAGPRLLAVADGMGGHAAGEVASAEAIAALAPLDADPPGADLITTLRDAVEAANQRLRDMVAADASLEGMGTTLTALLWADQRLGLAHVGDSRCYLLRDGKLTQITHDHTLVQSLVDEGRLSPEEASSHPQRSLITRALDGRGEVELDLSIRESRLDDRYLLCSDGLSGVVSEQTLLEALRERDPAVACEHMVELALRGGGPDNITCVVADVVDGPPDATGSTPIVVGAAGCAPDTPSSRSDTAAARAARATRTSAPPASPAARRAGRRPGRAVAIVSLLAMLALIGLALAGYLFDRAQWYLGVSRNRPPTLALYQGFNASLLGVALSDVAVRSRVPLSAFGVFEQQQILSGIAVSGPRAGRRKLAALGSEACAELAAALPPLPTAAPSPAANPPHARPSATPSPIPASRLAAIHTMRQIGCPSPAGASSP